MIDIETTNNLDYLASQKPAVGPGGALTSFVTRDLLVTPELLKRTAPVNPAELFEKQRPIYDTTNAGVCEQLYFAYFLLVEKLTREVEAKDPRDVTGIAQLKREFLENNDHIVNALEACRVNGNLTEDQINAVREVRAKIAGQPLRIQADVVALLSALAEVGTLLLRRWPTSIPVPSLF